MFWNIDNSASSAASATCTKSSYSANYGPTGSRALLVAVSVEDNGTEAGLPPTTVTFGGVSLTKIDDQAVGSSYQNNISWWWLKNPSTSSGDVVATWDAAVGEAHMHIMVACVDESGTAASSKTSGTSVSSISHSVTPGSDGALILGAVTCGDTGAESPQNDDFATELSTVTDGSSNSTVGYWIAARASEARTIDWQLFASRSRVAACAVALPVDLWGIVRAEKALAETGHSSLTLSSFNATGGTTGSRRLVVGLVAEDASSGHPNVSSIAFNTSESLTEDVRVGTVTSGGSVAELWSLGAPTSTTANIVATYAASVDRSQMVAMLLTGVGESGSPVTNSNEASGTSDSLSVTPADASAFMIDIIAHAGSPGGPTADGYGVLAYSDSYDSNTHGISAGILMGPDPAASQAIGQSSFNSAAFEHVAAAYPGPGVSVSQDAVAEALAEAFDGAASLPVVVTQDAVAEIEAEAYNGHAFLGASWCAGYQWAELPDTLFLSQSDDGTPSELATDLGQDDDDLTVGTDVVYENGDRFDPGSSGTVVLRVTMSTASDGYFFDTRNSASSNRLRLYLSGGSIIMRASNASGTTTESFVPVDLTATEKEFIIALAWEPNPDTSGDSDELTVWVYLFDIAAQTAEIQNWGAYAPGTCDWRTHFLASTSTGSNAFDGTCTEIAAYNGFYPSPVVWNWFVEPFDEDTITGRTRIEVPMPASSSNAADEDQPVSLVALAAGGVQQADRRLLSPIINEVYNAVTIEDPEGAFMGSPSIYAPGQSELELLVGYIKYRPIAKNLNRLYCRLHVSITEDATHKFSVYSMSKRPGQAGGGLAGSPPEPMKFERTDVSNGTIATTGMHRLDLGELDIVLDSQGFTWLGLAVLINSTTTIHGWHVSPHSVEETGTIGGFGLPP